ncbi:MAG: pantetheine-phosphate adenylyltransferase [Candidatus Heimdallarchaeota archaeon]|nr:pantetheine-phosphate adenylyltransferase [Candidatus Heimdallarchaeota archaeon]MBY8994770.1 pantetheine-phosphate adenylyltransferase [Candidatus Heimdallarchaeota archaeon]
MTKINDYQFEYACLGGTFDRLHGGHKLLLEVAFKLAKRVLIGITTDNLAKNGKEIPELIWNFEKRAKDVTDFLHTLGVSDDRIDIKPLSRATQYADEIPELGVIVLSPETYGRLLEINDVRRKNGLDELIAIAIPYHRDEHGKIVSSKTFRELELKLEQQKRLKDEDASL